MSSRSEPLPVVRIRLVPLSKEPEKARKGDVVYADGVNWNPGKGEGVYVRLDKGWEKLKWDY